MNSFNYDDIINLFKQLGSFNSIATRYKNFFKDSGQRGEYGQMIINNLLGPVWSTADDNERFLNLNRLLDYERKRKTYPGPTLSSQPPLPVDMGLIAKYRFQDIPELKDFSPMTDQIKHMNFIKYLIDKGLISG